MGFIDKVITAGRSVLHALIILFAVCEFVSRVHAGVVLLTHTPRYLARKSRNDGKGGGTDWPEDTSVFVFTSHCLSPPLDHRARGGHRARAGCRAGERHDRRDHRETARYTTLTVGQIHTIRAQSDERPGSACYPIYAGICARDLRRRIRTQTEEQFYTTSVIIRRRSC